MSSAAIRALAALLLLPLSGGCFTGSTVTIPGAGEKAPDSVLKQDDKGRWELDLSSKHKYFKYKGFTIVNPNDSRFVAYVSRNAAAVAEWQSRETPADFEFYASAIRYRLNTPVKTTGELEKLYRKNYLLDPSTIRYTGKIVKRDGLEVVEFVERARMPDTGKILLIRGFILLDPSDPEYAIEALYYRRAYDNRIADVEMEKLGEKFLKAVKVHRH